MARSSGDKPTLKNFLKILCTRKPATPGADATSIKSNLSTFLQSTKVRKRVKTTASKHSSGIAQPKAGCECDGRDVQSENGSLADEGVT